MIVTRLGPLTIIGENLRLHECLGSEVMKDGIRDADIGLKAEAGIPHQCDLHCQAEAIGRAMTAADQVQIFDGKRIVTDDPTVVIRCIEQAPPFFPGQ
jgi:hypothetical protein